MLILLLLLLLLPLLLLLLPLLPRGAGATVDIVATAVVATTAAIGRLTAYPLVPCTAVFPSAGNPISPSLYTRLCADFPMISGILVRVFLLVSVSFFFVMFFVVFCFDLFCVYSFCPVLVVRFVLLLRTAVLVWCIGYFVFGLFRFVLLYSTCYRLPGVIPGIFHFIFSYS